MSEIVPILRVKLDVEVQDITSLTTRARHNQLQQIASARREITKALRTESLAGPQARYDVKYSKASRLAELTSVPCQFSGTHYWFWSPVLEREVLNSLVESSGVHGPKILDVGAGNGTLLQRFKELGFGVHLMTGVDISEMAVQRIRELGFSAYQGKLQNLELETSHYDVVFLSYFVDRDIDQRVTFEKSVEVLRTGGTVVLEGWFPCVLEDTSGRSYGSANVTKGVDAVEDIELVVAEFARLGITLIQVLVGQRLVYSMDGPEILPSYTLIFKK